MHRQQEMQSLIPICMARVLRRIMSREERFMLV